ncbi:MAG: NACHT domain-containing NTPase [Cyanobacteriota bacterium]|nr:NACHT domain-containing NTPase [Cyanobacteriota bacterium]
MAKRSLKACEAGITKAKSAFQRKGWTQEYLAAEVGLSTRQSIWKFFTGRPIDRHVFVDICFHLELDWEEIADLPPISPPSSETASSDRELSIEALVSTLRSQLVEPIQATCGTLQSSLDMTQPLLLDRIYTHVNILPHLSHQRWLEVSDLQQTQAGSNRVGFSQNANETVSGMEAVSRSDKLAILGKPGAGKTTFLQHIAIECSRGQYRADCIPVFIQLRGFAVRARDERDFSLVPAIVRQWTQLNIECAKVESLLQHGKILLLLDGLDEVPESEKDDIILAIDRFAKDYYKNQIIITSRLADRPYRFRGFTYIEIADFSQSQIESFARKWFTASSVDSPEDGIETAETFLEKLQKKENQPIRELVVTPILLSLVCSVFQEREMFPTKRSKLYQAGLDILLDRWDNARGIQRDVAYRKLSRADKIKLLGQIAIVTFENGNYFFEKSEILQIISDYLLAFTDANPDPETLWLDSEAVLKSIQLQHGLLVERARDIYSFSHLTFQEYLSARRIIGSPTSEALELASCKLATHTSEPRWQEVILLAASMLPQADFLLLEMKRNVDAIVEKYDRLQMWLVSLARKANTLQSLEKSHYKPAAVRGFYFTLFGDRDLNLATSIDVELSRDLCPDLSLDLTLARAFNTSISLVENPNIQEILALIFALDLERTFPLADAMKDAIAQLKSQLPDLETGKEALRVWWQTQGSSWVAQFRAVIVEYRQIGRDWQWSATERRILQQYYDANQFLVDCLNSDAHTSASAREEIESTLLLPPESISTQPLPPDRSLAEISRARS